MLAQLGTDRMLLFSTDYPHWHFDGDEALPAGFPEALLRRLLAENPLRDLSPAAGGRGMTPDDVRTLDTAGPRQAPGCASSTATSIPRCVRRATCIRSWRSAGATIWTPTGCALPMPFTGSSPYPKSAPALSRDDAWPPNGGPPGSDLDFLRTQLLDAYDMRLGILHLLGPTGMDQRNQEFGAAICRAINDWQVATWTGPENRLKGSIVVPGRGCGGGGRRRSSTGRATRISRRCRW